MPLCPTRYFGRAEYDESAIVEFPAGLPGFETETRFLPLNIPAHAPLVFLQSLGTADLCFIALPVLVLEPGYQLDVAEPDLVALGLDPNRQPAIGGGVLCLAFLTISETGVTANLLAPVVINLKNGRAVQAVSPGSRYSHQHPVRAPEEVVCS